MTDDVSNRKPPITPGAVRDVFEKGYLTGPLGNGFRPGMGEVQGGYIGPSSALPAFPDAPSGFNPVNTPAAPAQSAPASAPAAPSTSADDK